MKVERVTIHCTDLEWGTPEGIRRYHKSRGWSDIGYHFVITNGKAGKGRDPNDAADGVVWPGRPLTRQGAGVRGNNENNVQVVLVGKPGEFTRAQYMSLLRWLKDFMREHYLCANDIYGHYEFDSRKTCPGISMGLLRAAMRVYLI